MRKQLSEFEIFWENLIAKIELLYESFNEVLTIESSCCIWNFFLFFFFLNSLNTWTIMIWNKNAKEFLFIFYFTYCAEQTKIWTQIYPFSLSQGRELARTFLRIANFEGAIDFADDFTLIGFTNRPICTRSLIRQVANALEPNHEFALQFDKCIMKPFLCQMFFVQDLV